MEQQNRFTTALQTMGIIPLYNKEEEIERLKEIKKLATSFIWKLKKVDVALINGYYLASARQVEEIIQTPFENYCIALVDDHYELFKIGDAYRPMAVPFCDHLEIKHWFEQKLGHQIA